MLLKLEFTCKKNDNPTLEECDSGNPHARLNYTPKEVNLTLRCFHYTILIQSTLKCEK